MNKQEIAEKLKENEKALCRLSEEERIFLQTHKKDVVGLNHNGSFRGRGDCIVTNTFHVYRLHRDFQLPLEERFFFPIGVDLLNPEKCQPKGRSDCAASYCYNAPDAEIKCLDHHCCGCICDISNRTHLKQWIAEQGGQREKGPEFDVYKVEADEGTWYYTLDPKYVAGFDGILGSLPCAYNKVGFAGVQFKGLEGWHPEMVKFDADGLPLVPEKVRFLK